jgi:NDP-sugar pyrophosphorylase family protein
MINIVIPMAGHGLRFSTSAHEAPKPLIEVVPGKCMVEYVIDSLRLSEPHRFHFVCRSEHVAAFNLNAFFTSRVGSHAIIETAAPTSGPAASALLAAPFIDNDDELLIAYSDTFLTEGISDFLRFCRGTRADGAVLTYASTNPAYAYARIDEDGRVLATAEKELIGPNAAADQYYFRRSSAFVAAARRMIARERPASGEHFVSSVYNEMIADGAVILSYPIAPGDEVVLGTPEDLLRFQAAAARRDSPLVDA